MKTDRQTIMAIISVVFGILVIVMPQLLAYLVGAYLILQGLSRLTR